MRTGAARVLPGRVVRVVVPGSSANLGPGYDAVGLALALTDAVDVEALAPGGPAAVEVTGEGSASVVQGPSCERHLVVASLRAALHAWGVPGEHQPGLVLRCRNGVPHGRGVGSSAAAVVAGVAAAAALLEVPVGLAAQVDVASALEGHPDNAAASLLGGVTLGWHDAPVTGPPPAASTAAGLPAAATAGGRFRAVRVEPHAELDALLCLPDAELSTARARAMLPLQVRHADAAHTAGRAALLVEAMTRRPDLLLEATEDRLHQQHRAAAMPAAWSLLGALRAAGHAAVVSGAGPSLLVLTGGGVERAAAEVADVAGSAWRVLRPGIARSGARTEVVAGAAGPDSTDSTDSTDSPRGGDGPSRAEPR